MTTIYHNPRCRKSRETLQLLEDKNEDLNIVKYLENPPSKEELKDIIKLLAIEPIALVRKNEQIWKDQFKGKELTQEEVIDAMIDNPKLIERPIVVKNNKATIGRPPENVLSIL
ncbi:arsenate reductase (glutaredoxin) [Marixanthomonas sp. SCSIO 43207]|uniref:arsenate reductase (glutaredoxin) n=1 Tax=Marixanthomonas sp. SCSIO 43207 TaxID=2779360 RepID=UPI001CA91DD7|nr:arsenate reductase (glutaredoxin) [Marixanthomonas sp. SCSIO 43207]UAB80790.1 arsenate reductase (glutaredoxin) [Marixanthomonas sp. SCSIO 43207]